MDGEAFTLPRIMRGKNSWSLSAVFAGLKSKEIPMREREGRFDTLVLAEISKKLYGSSTNITRLGAASLMYYFVKLLKVDTTYKAMKALKYYKAIDMYKSHSIGLRGDIPMLCRSAM